MKPDLSDMPIGEAEAWRAGYRAAQEAESAMPPFVITQVLHRGVHQHYSWLDTASSMFHVRQDHGFATWDEARAAGWDVRACNVRVMPAEPPA